MKSAVAKLARPVIAALLLGTVSAAAEPAPIAKIEKIAIRLVYTTTGAFSPDIADPAKFVGWNTIIGEGDAKEPANDLLVQVYLKMDRPEGNLAQPLAVRVTGGGKPLGQHACKGIFFRDGRSVCTFIVTSATCAGKIVVQASIGRGERKSAGVTLACGE